MAGTVITFINIITQIYDKMKTSSNKEQQTIPSKGEIILYQTADGKYRYDHATSTTERWGSPTWKEVLKGSGFADTREAVVEEAKKFGSAGFVLFAGDDKPHSISEFLADKK